MKNENKSSTLREIIKKYHKYLVLEMINELKIKGCDQRALIEKYKTKLPPGMTEELKTLKDDGNNEDSIQ